MNTRRRGFWRWLDELNRQWQLRALLLAAIAAVLLYLYRSWRG
jgi:hypothetical protein